MRTKKHLSKGFTFIELMVVIAIFGIIAGIVLFNYSGFQSNITLDNLSHDIALQINQAQKIAISGQTNVRLPSFTSSVGGFHPRYGVYFQNPANTTNLNLDNPPKQFIYFTDLPNNTITAYDGSTNSYNWLYDRGNDCASPTTECLDKVIVQSGDSISDICVNQKASVPGPCGISDLAVTFTRPFPDAVFKSLDPNFPVTPSDPSDVEIVVTSNKGSSKTIIVTKLGQVYIQDGAPLTSAPCVGAATPCVF